MKTIRTLYHLLRADFLERVRSYGFLALLLFTVFLTYLFIPEINDVQIAGLNLGGYRGFYEKYGFTARPDDSPGMQYIK